MAAMGFLHFLGIFLLGLSFVRCEEEKKTFEEYKVLRTANIEDQETVATLLKFDGNPGKKLFKAFYFYGF